jgi:hypothetical protein
VGTLALLRWPTVKVLGWQVHLFDLGGAIAIVGMGLMLMVSAIRHTRILYRQEKIS